MSEQPLATDLAAEPAAPQPDEARLPLAILALPVAVSAVLWAAIILVVRAILRSHG